MVFICRILFISADVSEVKLRISAYSFLFFSSPGQAPLTKNVNRRCA